MKLFGKEFKFNNNKVYHEGDKPVANDIVFTDGQTFQQKLDNGTLKGEKGDTGSRGPQGDVGPMGPRGTQGVAGTKGIDGITWRPSVDQLGNLTWTKNQTPAIPEPANIKGPKGDKGDIGDFPDTLPAVPKLSYKLNDLSIINLKWTFEDKLYYQYELYGSTSNGFTPSDENLIYQGKSNSHTLQAIPGEVWYFKVCAKNSHDRKTSFSEQVKVITQKSDDINIHFSEKAVGEAVANSLNDTYIKKYSIKGEWLMPTNISVFDSHENNTLNISPDGDVSIISKNIKKLYMDEVVDVVSKPEMDRESYNIKRRIEEAGGYNRLENSTFLNGTASWEILNWNNVGNYPGASTRMYVNKAGEGEWLMNNRNILVVEANDLSNDNGNILGVGADYNGIWGGTKWTLSMKLACHRAKGITVEIIEYRGGQRQPLVNSWHVDGTYYGGQSRNGWYEFNETFSLLNEGIENFSIRVFLQEWNGELSSAILFIAEPHLTLGERKNLPFIPRYDEFYTEFIKIKKDAIDFRYMNEKVDQETSFITIERNPSNNKRCLRINGADGIKDLVIYEGTPRLSQQVLETSGDPHVYHEAWGNWDFKGYNIYNANVTRKLSDPSQPINSNNRLFTRDAHSIMSTKEILEESGEDTTSNGFCLIEIPNDIKYNIGKYDVSIIKYNKGDIWVSQRTPDYFVVESDTDMKFTWILKGELLETQLRQQNNQSFVLEDEL